MWPSNYGNSDYGRPPVQPGMPMAGGGSSQMQGIRYPSRPPPPPAPPAPPKSIQGPPPGIPARLKPPSSYNASNYSEYDQSEYDEYDQSDYAMPARSSNQGRSYSSGYEDTASGNGSIYSRPGMAPRKAADFGGDYAEDSSYGGASRYDNYGQGKQGLGRDSYGYDSYDDTSYDKGYGNTKGYGDMSEDGYWNQDSYSASAPKAPVPQVGDVVSEPSWPWQYCEDCDIRFKSEQSYNQHCMGMLHKKRRQDNEAERRRQEELKQKAMAATSKPPARSILKKRPAAFESEPDVSEAANDPYDSYGMSAPKKGGQQPYSEDYGGSQGSSDYRGSQGSSEREFPRRDPYQQEREVKPKRPVDPYADSYGDEDYSQRGVPPAGRTDPYGERHKPDGYSKDMHDPYSESRGQKPYDSYDSSYNDPYRGKADPYQAKTDPYHAKPDPYQAKPDPYQAKPDPYQAKPDPYQTKGDPYQTRTGGDYDQPRRRPESGHAYNDPYGEGYGKSEAARGDLARSDSPYDYRRERIDPYSREIPDRARVSSRERDDPYARDPYRDRSPVTRPGWDGSREVSPMFPRDRPSPYSSVSREQSPLATNVRRRDPYAAEDAILKGAAAGYNRQPDDRLSQGKIYDERVAAPADKSEGLAGRGYEDSYGAKPLRDPYDQFARSYNEGADGTPGTTSDPYAQRSDVPLRADARLRDQQDAPLRPAQQTPSDPYGRNVDSTSNIQELDNRTMMKDRYDPYEKPTTTSTDFSFWNQQAKSKVVSDVIGRSDSNISGGVVGTSGIPGFDTLAKLASAAPVSSAGLFGASVSSAGFSDPSTMSSAVDSTANTSFTLTQDKMREDAEKEKNKEYRCKACNVDAKGVNSWKSHLQGKKHTKNLIQKFQEEDLEPLDFCQQYLSKDITVAPISSDFPPNFMNLLLREFFGKPAGGTTMTVQEKNSYKQFVLSSGVKNNFYCRTCTKSFYCSELWVLHIVGMKHAEKCQEILNDIGKVVFMKKYSSIPGPNPDVLAVLEQKRTKEKIEQEEAKLAGKALPSVRETPASKPATSSTSGGQNISVRTAGKNAPVKPLTSASGKDAKTTDSKKGLISYPLDHLSQPNKMLFPAAAKMSGSQGDADKPADGSDPVMPEMDDNPEETPDTQKLLAAAAGISLASLKIPNAEPEVLLRPQWSRFIKKWIEDHRRTIKNDTRYLLPVYENHQHVLIPRVSALQYLEDEDEQIKKGNRHKKIYFSPSRSSRSSRSRSISPRRERSSRRRHDDHREDSKGRDRSDDGRRRREERDYDDEQYRRDKEESARRHRRQEREYAERDSHRREETDDRDQDIRSSRSRKEATDRHAETDSRHREEWDTRRGEERADRDVRSSRTRGNEADPYREREAFRDGEGADRDKDRKSSRTRVNEADLYREREVERADRDKDGGSSRTRGNEADPYQERDALRDGERSDRDKDRRSSRTGRDEEDPYRERDALRDGERSDRDKDRRSSRTRGSEADPYRERDAIRDGDRADRDKDRRSSRTRGNEADPYRERDTLQDIEMSGADKDERSSRYRGNEANVYLEGDTHRGDETAYRDKDERTSRRRRAEADLYAEPDSVQDGALTNRDKDERSSSSWRNEAEADRYAERANRQYDERVDRDQDERSSRSRRREAVDHQEAGVQEERHAHDRDERSSRRSRKDYQYDYSERDAHRGERESAVDERALDERPSKRSRKDRDAHLAEVPTHDIDERDDGSKGHERHEHAYYTQCERDIRHRDERDRSSSKRSRREDDEADFGEAQKHISGDGLDDLESRRIAREERHRLRAEEEEHRLRAEEELHRLPAEEEDPELRRSRREARHTRKVQAEEEEIEERRARREARHARRLQDASPSQEGDDKSSRGGESDGKDTGRTTLREGELPIHEKWLSKKMEREGNDAQKSLQGKQVKLRFVRNSDNKLIKITRKASPGKDEESTAKEGRDERSRSSSSHRRTDPEKSGRKEESLKQNKESEAESAVAILIDVSDDNSSDVVVLDAEISSTEKLPDAETAAVSATDVSATDVSATDVTATDVSATDVTATDVTATDVAATDVTATDVTATDVTATDVTATDVSSAEQSSDIKIPGICETSEKLEDAKTSNGSSVSDKGQLSESKIKVDGSKEKSTEVTSSADDNADVIKPVDVKKSAASNTTELPSEGKIADSSSTDTSKDTLKSAQDISKEEKKGTKSADNNALAKPADDKTADDNSNKESTGTKKDDSSVDVSKDSKAVTDGHGAASSVKNDDGRSNRSSERDRSRRGDRRDRRRSRSRERHSRSRSADRRSGSKSTGDRRRSRSNSRDRRRSGSKSRSRSTRGDRSQGSSRSSPRRPRHSSRNRSPDRRDRGDRDKADDRSENEETEVGQGEFGDVDFSSLFPDGFVILDEDDEGADGSDCTEVEVIEEIEVVEEIGSDEEMETETHEIEYEVEGEDSDVHNVTDASLVSDTVNANQEENDAEVAVQGEAREAGDAALAGTGIEEGRGAEEGKATSGDKPGENGSSVVTSSDGDAPKSTSEKTPSSATPEEGASSTTKSEIGNGEQKSEEPKGVGQEEHSEGVMGKLSEDASGDTGTSDSSKEHPTSTTEDNGNAGDAKKEGQSKDKCKVS